MIRGKEYKLIEYKLISVPAKTKILIKWNLLIFRVNRDEVEGVRYLTYGFFEEAPYPLFK